MAARGYELAADAQAELDDAVADLERARRDRGMSFLVAVEQTLEMIVEYPDIGRRTRRRLRVFSMTGWPYKLVYSLEGGVIMVWVIAHHKRKPGYWRKRAPH